MMNNCVCARLSYIIHDNTPRIFKTYPSPFNKSYDNVPDVRTNNTRDAATSVTIFKGRTRNRYIVIFPRYI